jgi:septum formation topological specificity factor MinE
MDEYVTQADREAAADILQYYHGYANLVRAGEVDAHKVVQIVAAHRRASVAAVEEKNAAILRKLRSDVLEILRRHKVRSKCLAEVAVVTSNARCSVGQRTMMVLLS